MVRVAVTGALSYSGRYLTRLLLDGGHSVVSLSRRSKPLAPKPLLPSDLTRLEMRPLDFSDERALGSSLEGCDVLVCTYWIRFAINGDTHAAAAARCSRLFELARQAGVRRVVFTSHTQASQDSPFPYLAAKAKTEAALRSCGIPSYAIARPCGIFGDTPAESILMNNAAWIMRRTPIMLLPGNGHARFQPVHARDMAELLFEMGVGHESSCVAEHAASYACDPGALPNQELDACGPDAPEAKELFERIAQAIGCRTAVVAPGFLSPRLVTAMTKPFNWLTGDVLLDTDDLEFLESGLTVANDPGDPRIKTRRSLMTWLDEVGPELGKEYISSIGRYYNRQA